jgi:hypothetical protein
MAGAIDIDGLVAASAAACWPCTTKLSRSAAATHCSMFAGCGGSITAFGLRRLSSPRILADQHVQRVTFHLKFALGSDFLRGGQVEARLRLVGVGDRRRSDLEILFGLLELLGDGRLVGLHGAQVLDREEDIEVGLCDAHDQILSGLREVGFGLQDQQFRLVVLDEILPAEQRLRQVDAIGVAVVFRLVSSAALANGGCRRRRRSRRCCRSR